MEGLIDGCESPFFSVVSAGTEQGQGQFAGNACFCFLSTNLCRCKDTVTVASLSSAWSVGGMHTQPFARWLSSHSVWYDHAVSYPCVSSC